jgi:hypothetical protein
VVVGKAIEEPFLSIISEILYNISSFTLKNSLHSLVFVKAYTIKSQEEDSNLLKYTTGSML